MMAEQKPPTWETDSLSKYFADAEYNERVTAINYPDVFDVLRRVQRAFEHAEEAVEKGFARGQFSIPRILLPRTHSAVLAAIRLSMSGQSAEAQGVLRSAIEQAWYALHIGTDPTPWTRAEIWLRRNETDQTRAECKREFTIANVRATHEAHDATTAADLHGLYDILIDFGGHPNPLGVLSSIHRVEEVDRIDYKIGILFPDELRVMMGLRLAVAVAVGVLRVFRSQFPERFTLVGLDEEITHLVSGLNTVFTRFAQPKPAA